MEKIDFVILWVDGNDPNWLVEKNKYLTSNNLSATGSNRFRDWGLLKYWFRGVEKFAPWVNKIHFITWGHVPEWLDTQNPKINIVKHEDFIPKKYLPTFNSNVIQYYLDRIPGLAEKFVMFDDDMYIINNVKQTDFFIGDKICDIYGEKPIFIGKKSDKYPHCLINNMQVINEKYSKIKFYKKNIFKCLNLKYGVSINLRTLYLFPIRQFIGICSQHICQAYTKEYYKKFWKICGDELEIVSNNRFRETTDFSTFLIRYMELLDGNFVPRSVNFGKRIELNNEKEKNNIYKAITKQKYKVLCINDSDENINVDKVRPKLENCFESILSVKSSFEK